AFHSPDEELVYSFTRELNLTRSVSDDLYARTVAELGPDATVDLVGILGYYSLISMTIKAFDVSPPDGG
ncbi:MAG: carboxymuconolactone decarboxylase family protein, partial [Candidatus Puniceispirillaceae bacterium]